jgi:hypothetical protein
MMEPGPTPKKWARRGEPGNGDLQLLESCETDEVEVCPATNQDVVQPDVGDGRGDGQRELLGPAMFLGQSKASNTINVSIHLWWDTTLYASAAAATTWCNVLMTLLDVMSQEPPYMTWSCLWHSMSLDSES